MAMMVVGCGVWGGFVPYHVFRTRRFEEGADKNKNKRTWWVRCTKRRDGHASVAWCLHFMLRRSEKKKDSRYKDSYRERERKKVRLDRRPWVEARW